MFLFSHFGSFADIGDSPDVSLACTDDNYDLLLSETNYGYAFLAAIIEALKASEILEGGQGAGACHHGILEYDLPTPNIACFYF